MSDDATLLRQYAAEGRDPAFAELVRRHVDFVYSAALRQLAGDEHLARDATQLVFIDLARKARPLADHPLLLGWLHTATHHATAKLVRTEQRRRAHEQKACAMSELSSDPAADWAALRPLLDRALLDLSEADRAAVLLRFFEKRSFAEIGTRLRLGEDGARKRVERALDKLHAALARRGIGSSAAALATALTANAVQAAPVGLAAAAATAALQAASTVPLVITFSMTAKWIAAAVIVGGAAVTGWKTHESTNRLATENATLTAQVARQESRLEPARERLRQLRQQSVSTNDDEEVFDPKALARATLYLHPDYVRLLRAPVIPSTALDALKVLLNEKLYALNRARAIAKYRGLSEEVISQYALLLNDAVEPIDRRLQRVLGPTAFAYFENYEHTLPYRRALGVFDSPWILPADVIDDRQMDRLVQALADSHRGESDAFTDGLCMIPESVVADASSYLTVKQVAALRRMQAMLAAEREIFIRNRSAAQRGEIQLSAGSAMEYAPRTEH